MVIRKLARRLKYRPFLFCSCAMFVVVSSLESYAQTSQNHADLLHQLSESFQNVARKVSPAVVQIMVTGYGIVQRTSSSEAALIGRQRVTGSGVIVDGDGYIITNAHVVAGAEKVRVVLTSRMATGSPNAVLRSTNRTLDATIIGVDKQIDLALLKVEEKGLPSLSLADYRNARQGEVVLAFGSPEGLENTVTMGVISSVARQPVPERPMIYIQTDAPINPGNSGGPLVDVDGKVVGINTFILTQGGGSEGLGFAIPSSVVSHVYLQLKQFGHVHRKIIGAVVQPVTAELAEALSLAQDHGVVVADVLPGSPAESAGLKIQDIVLAVDGTPMESFPQFESFLLIHAKGDKLKLDLLRGKQEVTIAVPVVEQRDEIDRLADLIKPGSNLISRLGIVGVAIDEKVQGMLQGVRIPSGVIVAALTESAAARESGLASGDIIHAVNGSVVQTVEALRNALDRQKPGASVALQVERDGQLQFIILELE